MKEILQEEEDLSEIVQLVGKVSSFVSLSAVIFPWRVFFNFVSFAFVTVIRYGWSG